MGEITSGISILLGSAVVSTIITTIFNQYNNRKNNTLKYITEERKKSLSKQAIKEWYLKNKNSSSFKWFEDNEMEM